MTTQMIGYDELVTILAGGRFSISTSADQVEIINEALRYFYSAHDWSFMYKTTTLAVTALEADTDMPADFSQLTDPFSYEPDEYRGSPQQVESHEIRELRSANDYTNRMAYFALATDTFDPEVGERWKVLWFPRPCEDYTMHYRYRATPTIPTTGQFMRGDPRFTIAAMYCVYAAAASYKKDQRSYYADMRDEALARAIEQDKARFVGTTIGDLADYQHPEYVIHSTWTESS
jgi:hypothetical protein